MKVTTVRFGSDLWGLLEAEADRVGISVSQYIREAALARAAAAAGARGDDPLAVLGEMSPPASLDPSADPQRTETPARLTKRRAGELRSEAKALAAQSRQAIRHADELSRESDQMTGRRDAGASTMDRRE